MANGTLKVSNIETSSGSGTITLGQSGETVTIPSGCTFTNSGTATGFGGVTEIDYFRLSADVSGSGDSSYNDITSSWERVDTYNFEKLGTGLSQSSGIFSFPSTGYWKIDFNFANVTSENNYLRINLLTTNDNSNYNIAVETQAGQTQSNYAICAGFYIFNVTNITNDKFKFSQSTSGGSVQGNTSKSKSSFTCVRLADT
jgi:hypothetical protein|tara:strand:+ start:475 stop:1074 length:600 start_codon:yes stop_codon:yes gene_type:complete